MTCASKAGGFLTATILPLATLLLAASAISAADKPGAEQAEAQRILEATGVKGGLVVHLGCGDGRLTAALRANDSYLVHGLDGDDKRVQQAREHIHSLGLYGPVSIDRLEGRRLPYTDNLVNLVVVADLGRIEMDEVIRVLAPHGVAYVKQDARWTKTVKPRPAEIDEWTHYLHDASNNAVAEDSVVGPPRRFQWIAGPRWARSHDHLSSLSALVSSGGRIFYIVDEAPIAAVAIQPRWSLIARDAFSGVLLWKRPIDPWEGHLRGFRSGPTELARRLVAVGDRVYVTLGYGKPISALDAATGETVKVYDETKNALEIICHDGRLFAVVGDRLPDNTADAAKQPEPAKVWMWWPVQEEKPPKKHIVALQADSGAVLWKKDDADTAELMPTTLSAAGRRVFFQSHKEVLALEAASGKPAWRAARPVSRHRPSWSATTLVIKDGVVLSGDRAVAAKPSDTSQPEKAGRWMVDSRGGIAPKGKIIAFSADSGRKLWESDGKEVYNAPVDVLVAGGLVWSGQLVGSREPGITAGLDLHSGEVKRTRPRDQTFFKIIMGHHRCYRNKATEKYLVLGRDGIELIDVATGKGFGHAWVRGSCQYGVMPCNGLIYSPHHSCACHIESKINSFNALSSKLKAESGKLKETLPRLQQGPASSLPLSAASSQLSEAWPTYRHDAGRSGRASCAVPAELKPAWETELAGARLSSPVVAGGKVFVARIDAHAVCALDAADGKLLWSFTAGGRVDSPPTIHGPTAIFGSADGWIYSISAADGKLAWRFRAAPEDRRIVSYGQLESAWPVHGSVLVEDGIVWAVAGRTTFLDGGMFLYRLDAKSGKMLSEKPITGPALPDVLSSDGTSVYLRHRRFDRQGAEQPASVAHLYSPAGFLDDSWWHRTYWLLGRGMRSNWGGWPVSGGQVPSGRLLVLDESAVYGFGRFNQYHRNGSHVGLGRMRYLLYASPLAGTGKEEPGKAKRRRGGQSGRVASLWSESMPLLARGMVLCEKTLFVSGPPDVFPCTDEATHPYRIVSADALHEQEAALAGKRGGLLLAVSATDGKKLADYKLDAPPAWDGMAAANGRLYLSLADGKVVCMQKRAE